MERLTSIPARPIPDFGCDQLLHQETSGMKRVSILDDHHHKVVALIGFFFSDRVNMHSSTIRGK